MEGAPEHDRSRRRLHLIESAACSGMMRRKCHGVIGILQAVTNEIRALLMIVGPISPGALARNDQRQPELAPFFCDLFVGQSRKLVHGPRPLDRGRA